MSEELWAAFMSSAIRGWSSKINLCVYVLLMVAAMWATILQQTVAPIKCLCPADLTKAECDSINIDQLCWDQFVQRTNLTEVVNMDPRGKWMSGLLLFMAGYLTLPSVVLWFYLPSKGRNLQQFEADGPENFADNVCSMLENGNTHRSIWKWFLGFKIANFVISVKLMSFHYLLLNEERILSFGVTVIRKMLAGENIDLSNFPACITCPILSGRYTYYSHCDLPPNQYHQIIIICLWFLCAIVVTVNFFPLFHWYRRLTYFPRIQRLIESLANEGEFEVATAVDRVNRLGYEVIVVLFLVHDTFSTSFASKAFRKIYDKIGRTD